MKERTDKDLPFGYYFYEDLEKMMDEEELKKFGKWIRGQTCALIDNKCAYYAHDVERFLNLIRKGIPTYWD